MNFVLKKCLNVLDLPYFHKRTVSFFSYIVTTTQLITLLRHIEKTYQEKLKYLRSHCISFDFIYVCDHEVIQK